MSYKRYIDEFLLSKRRTTTISCGKTAWERKQVHQYAQSLGISTKTIESSSMMVKKTRCPSCYSYNIINYRYTPDYECLTCRWRCYMWSREYIEVNIPLKIIELKKLDLEIITIINNILPLPLAEEIIPEIV